MMLASIFAKFLKKVRLSAIRHSTIHSTSKIEAGSSIIKSSFDRFSFCGYDCEIFYATIGSFTSIASGVVIGGARHPMEWVGMSPVFYLGRDSVRKKFSEHPLPAPQTSHIGHDVWIGRSAIILSGVAIGNGAVVGAGSIVTNDVPAYGIVAGSPARLIRYRFQDETINRLETLRWWELDDATLHRLAPHVRDPELFIKMLQHIRDERE